MRKETDKYSEKSLDLQHERNNLRKRVMDLDYEHKVVSANMIRAKRERDAQDKERREREAEEEKERRKQ